MYINDYIMHLQIDRSFSQNTVDTYLLNIKKYLKYCEKNNIDPLLIEYIDLLNYLSQLKNDENYKSKSINTCISSLKSYYTFLLTDGYIKNNPTSLLKSPKIEKRIPNYLSEEEMILLFSSIDTSTDIGKRDYLLISLLYDTGLRVSELLGIKINNIDFTNRTIKVLGKGNKERLVYFTNETLNIISLYLKEIFYNFNCKSNYLFSQKNGIVITRTEVYNIIVKYGKKAGINKHVTPHMIRHTFATHMILNDADVMSVKTILGHSNVSTTQIYTHFNKKELKKKYDEIKGRDN